MSKKLGDCAFFYLMVSLIEGQYLLKSRFLYSS